MVAAGSILYDDFGFVAVGSIPEESNLECRPSGRLVLLGDACTVVVDAGGSDAVDLPRFVTATEGSGHDFGKEKSAADIVVETWNTVVVASPVP